VYTTLSTAETSLGAPSFKRHFSDLSYVSDISKDYLKIYILR